MRNPVFFYLHWNTINWEVKNYRFPTSPIDKPVISAIATFLQTDSHMNNRVCYGQRQMAVSRASTLLSRKVF